MMSSPDLVSQCLVFIHPDDLNPSKQLKLTVVYCRGVSIPIIHGVMSVILPGFLIPPTCNWSGRVPVSNANGWTSKY